MVIVDFLAWVSAPCHIEGTGGPEGFGREQGLASLPILALSPWSYSSTLQAVSIHFGDGGWDTRLLLVEIVSDVMRSLLGVEGGGQGSSSSE